MTITQKLQNLRKFNLKMAGLHAAQGGLVLLLSRSFSIPLTTGYLAYDSTAQKLYSAQAVVFSLSLPLLIAIFFFLSAAAHLIIGTIYNRSYNKNLRKGINKVRWFEYAASASVMIVAIAMLVGIYDIATLATMFVLTALMNLLGLAMEVYNQGQEKPRWLAFNLGALAGLVPWLVIAFYFWTSRHYGHAAPPTFVYWIFVSIFVFFNCFAINMVLQYKKIGKWKDYLYGERAYIILSLGAKSLLAWQVFFGTLRP